MIDVAVGFAGSLSCPDRRSDLLLVLPTFWVAISPLICQYALGFILESD